MQRILPSFVFLLALVFLSACNLRGQFVRPTDRPLTWTPSPVISVTPTKGEVILPETGTPATEAALTLSPIPTARFTHTPSITPTRTVTKTPTITQTLRPTFTPTQTPTITSTPTLNPKAILLRIAEPGPMSKVTSPIEFVFHISPDFVGDTHIELIGEDGRQLFAKNFRTFATEGTTKVTQAVDFKIPGTAEVARLQVSTFDKVGHMLALSSVRVLLLSIGENQFTPAFPSLEHVLLRTPKWGDEISGGTIRIEGEIQPVNQKPIIVELIDQAGHLLSSQVLAIKQNNDAYQPFNISIPYHVEASKVVSRIIIRQDDDRIGGVAYFYSREIMLSP